MKHSTFISFKRVLIFSLLTSSFFLEAQDFKTVAYFPTYRFDLIDQVQLEKVTHLNIAFANPDANGQLETNGVDITPIVQKAHDAGLEVFIALAGGAAQLSDWEDWISPSKRSDFIHGIITYTIGHDLQGIDVDLEWGNVNHDYSGFVLELRDSTKQHGLTLSAALPGTYRYPEITNEALDAFDWVNMMIYDLTGPWNPTNKGHHSPYSYAENSIDYWTNQGVSTERLTLGVPFYGYDFTNTNNVKSLTFSQIASMNSNNTQLDQVGQIYYNGLPTIEKKTQLALEKLSGIMIWEIGQDSFDEYSLLSRIHETINNGLSTSISENIQNTKAIVYPNPVIDQVNIKFNQAQTAKITLIGIDGRIFDNQKIYQQKSVSFSMNGLSGGMYFIKVETAEFSISYKLVKIE